MPLQFLFASRQYMQFVDTESELLAPLDARELEPNRRYAVFLFLQNPDAVEYKNVTVTAWHDTFAAGVRGLSSLIIQSPPVDIPARGKNGPTVVMIRFLLMSPSAGRGRLAAKVLPAGPAVVQSVQIRPAVTASGESGSNCSVVGA
jgi:hypothetical protein